MLRDYALLHALFRGINKFRFRTLVIMMTEAGHPHPGLLLSIPLSITQRPGFVDPKWKHLFDVEHCLSNLSLSFFIPPCVFMLLSYSGVLCYVAITSVLNLKFSKIKNVLFNQCIMLNFKKKIKNIIYEIES